MRNEKLLRTILIATAGGLLIFLFIFAEPRYYLNTAYIQKSRTYLFTKLGFISSFISEIKKLNELTRENLALKEENTKLLSQLASQDELKDENDFLRNSLGLEHGKNHHITEARIYNIQFTPEGHYILLNKGTRDGVKKEGIVITSSGVLIGRVTEVFENFSTAIVVSDPDMKVTIKLLENNTLGIARGIFDNGIQLDFIAENDEVSEGNTVITSGNDLFPPGLIIGKIKNINTIDGGLFKKIEVEPEFKKIRLDRVLILIK